VGRWLEALRRWAGGPRPWRRLIGLERGLATALEAEQDRWFLWLPVLLGIGIGVYFALPMEPPIGVALAWLVAAIGLAAVWRQGIWGVVLTSAALTLSLGFAMAKLRALWVEAPVLVRTIANADVRGWIEEIEPRAAGSSRVTLRVAALADLAEAEQPVRVRVRIARSDLRLRVGEPVRLRARLSPPPLPALPGDYDFARRAFFQRLGAVGHALGAPTPDPVLGPAPWPLPLWAPIENTRRHVAERIAAVLKGDQAAIATALVQGDQGGISAATLGVMRDSGLAHILSISGLHMAIMAGALFWLVRAILALSPTLAQRWPVKSLAAVAASVGALLYLLLSGSQVPAVRSFLMIELMFLAVLAGRPAISLRNVAVAAMILLLARPENVHDVSFLMSFAATVGLVALYEHMGDRRRQAEFGPEPAGPVRVVAAVIAADVLTTLVAGLAIAPLAAYYFHKYQQYSVLGNLLALPVVTFWLMPLVLVLLIALPLGLEAWPLIGMGAGIDVLIAAATWVASLPGAVTPIPAMSAGAVVTMMLGALWFALWRRRWRWLGLVPAAAGIAFAFQRAPPDVLIGRDAEVLAVRRVEGLVGLDRRGGGYEMARWLEHDGDTRAVRSAASGRGFRCDSLGCSTEIKGLRLALVAHPAAAAEDCRGADIVVLRFPRAAGCAPRLAAIDLAQLRAMGTHVLWIDGAGRGARVRLLTVAEHRGERPWSRVARPASRRDPASRAAVPGRLPVFESDGLAPPAEADPERE
jgi:competence protein ComEC